MTEPASTPADASAAALRAELLRRRLSGGAPRARRSLPRVPRGGPLPLSAGQRQLWFLHQLDPAAPDYLLPVAYRLRGPLDTDALRAACDGLAARHEILRTRYVLDGTEPRQVIDAPGPVDFAEADREGLAAADREAAAREFAEEAALTPFDLAAQAPLRVRLLRFAADDHLLVLVLHHIACDAATRPLLLTELSALYRARRAGNAAAPQLAPEPVQYADYAAWLTERQDGPEVSAELDWWKRELAGLAALDLPTDRPRPAVRSWHGAQEHFTVPAPVAGRLRDVAAGHGATPFMVLLTAFQALLARYTGTPDVAVGTAVSARTRPELAGMAGYAYTSLVLRAAWSDEPPFAKLLERNRETVLAAFEHPSVPFDRLADALEPERDLSTTPVFQVMFDLTRADETEPLDLPGVAAAPVEVPGRIARFDLTVHLQERPDGSYAGSLEYATALFDTATARRIAGHYTRLLAAAAESPDTPVTELEIFDAAERALLLAGPAEPVGTRTPLDPAALRPVHEAIAARAAETPDATAILHGGHRTTYGELDALAHRMGHRLRALGAGPEDTVGVLLDRSPEMVATLLGIWRAGAAYVPLDPGYPDDRLAFMLADTGSRLVVTERRHAARLAATGARLVVLDEDAERAALADCPATPLAPPPGGHDPDHLAYVIYTSGSTGRPKGVLITHRGLANYLGWTADAYASAGTGGAPLFSSVAFDLGVPDLFTPLMTGQPVHLLDQDFEITELGRLLMAHAPYAFVKLTPGHLDLLTQQLTEEERTGLAGLVIAAGDAFTGRLANRWLSAAEAGGTRLAAEYGPTEITVGNSAYFIEGREDAELISIGRALPNTTMLVLDGRLRPVPLGSVGEVYIGGVGLARGYAGRPGLTAERFLPDPYGPPGARLYRTGDLARVLPDGNLDFVSRADHQVKLRGYRIEPGEIETVLTADAAVAEAVALVREDAPGDKRLVAYVVPAAGADAAALAPARLRGLLGAHLPEYMVPAAFVTLDALPLTANGKLDRTALPAPDRAATAVGEHIAPRDDDERAMAAVWCEVLGLTRVGVHDNFFDLGGDSLRAVALAGALRETGLAVAVRDLFEHRTVARLCAAVRDGAVAGEAGFRPVARFALLDAADRAALPADAVDAYPLSRTQAGMFVEMFRADGEHRYHNITSFRISDPHPFDPAAFRAAAALVVERHEAMRTSFALTGYTVPLQIVHARATMDCAHEDLRHLPEEERWPALVAFARADRMRLLDPARAPLMRMATHVLDDGGWWLSITEGHPAIEGWSYHNQLMELLGAYRRLRDGQQPDPAPPLPAVRYADFIAAELQSLADDTPTGDRAYWHQLLGRCEKFTLPAGWSGDPGAPAERYRIDLPLHDLVPGLRALASAAGVPYKSVLHAAHSKVLGLLTRQRTFRGGMVADARPEVRGAERVSGMYLNSVPFPYERTARTWGELAQQVFAAEVELWPHRRFPMPAMRRPGDPHLVDVLFHYLDFHQVDTELVDPLATRDDSPNEFPVVVGTPLRDHLTVASDTRTLRRDRADRLARLYLAVLADMAAQGPDGDARRGYPEEGEHGRELTELPDATRQLGDGTADVLAAFEAQAARTPDAVAVATADTHLTYAELDARAEALARRLRARGCGPEDRVGVLLDRGPDLVAALLAVWKAGAAYVPADPCTPDGRLATLFTGADCRLVVTEPAHAGRTAGIPTILADEPDAPSTTDEPRAADRAPARLAYVLHTSGSTGAPKGVAVEHRALAHYLRWAVRAYAPDGPANAPFFTSIGADLGVPALFVPLLTGGTVRLLPQRFAPEEFGRLLAAGGPYTFTGMTPGHLALLEQQLSDGELAGLADQLVCAGDAYPAGQAARVAERIAAAGGRTRLAAEYGPTEATVAAAAHRVASPPDRPLVPLGRALPGTVVRMLDERLAPVPDGVTGEIYLGGPGLARGYAGQPGLTAAHFLPDPYGPPGARLYRTGDLARVLPDGTLEFTGRVGRQLKVRGHRVEPAEIEAALTADPRVRAARVAAPPDAAGAPRLTAWIVPAPGRPPRPAELRERLRTRLPAAFVPAAYELVDALPLTAHGKYDRTAAADPSGASREATAVRAPYTAPRTDTERRLAEVWRQVLGLDRIGVHDDFADLGGDSLLVLRVLAGAAAAGLDLDPATALRHPTVAELADALNTPSGDR
ncbi:non-ribosomal peptide synthetase [Streptomyces sp. NRRL F-4489]|uniref:non-ribosomal peptide synthetase n=1 Tax=Streptomyces sp. NRRL F-4489 TaxID=1609095 RepID=UPI000747663C|nr:non-ribosomal peptide synthetase [Streptomyces sp. NRRL F-4489]KUL55238.1 non-ribosomal peptide synthetase [Streptomyces sp. NRRL F-4489]